MRRAAIAFGMVALLSSSCGSTNDLPAPLATRLGDRVERIRSFAESGQPGLALHQIELLADLVSLKLEQGALDKERAMEILDSADVVASQLSLLPRPSPSEVPSPSPVEGDGHGNGKDKGHGDEGNGND